MALLFIDGFDAYGNTDGENVVGVLQEAGYTTFAGFNTNAYTEVKSSTRTNIGFSIDPCVWSHGGGFGRAFPTASGIVTGFAVQLQVASFQNLCSILYNNYIGGVFTQLTMYANGAQGITVESGTGVYVSAPNVLFDGVWQYIEIKYSPGTGTSYLEVRVDGVTVISVTNESLAANGAANVINMFQFNGDGVSFVYFDDWYLCDLTGSSFNDFLGDCVVHSLLPVSDGGTNTMAQTGGTTGSHYTSVNDVPSDDDTSYLSSNTSGQKELFNLSTIPTDIVTVLALSVNVTARKDAPGIGFYKSCLVSGTTEVDSPQYSAPISYSQTQFLMPTAPGGGAWTNTAAQNAKIGFFIP